MDLPSHFGPPKRFGLFGWRFSLFDRAEIGTRAKTRRRGEGSSL